MNIKKLVIEFCWELALLATIVLCLSVSAFAADSRCAIDTDGNLSYDSFCTGLADKDLDGYVAANDADDNNKFIYPGVATKSGCSQVGFPRAREAQSNGTWGSCSTNEYCPSGCLACYYIDGDTGNDTTGTGSWAAPWATHRVISTYFNSPGSKPAGGRTLTAGDCVLTRNASGTTTYSTQYTDGGTWLFYLRNTSGNSTNRIRVMGYPDEFPTLSSSGADASHLYISDYVDFEGFTVKALNGKGVTLSGGNFDRVRRNKILDVDGDQNDNLAAIYVSGHADGDISNNYIRDVYDRVKFSGSGLTENNSGIVNFTPERMLIHHNEIISTTTSKFNCIKYKHMGDNITTLSQRSEIYYNVCWETNGGGYALGFAGPTWVHDNYIELSTNADGVQYRDFGGPNFFRIPTLLEYNTFRGGGFSYQTDNANSSANPTPTPISSFEFKNNIFVDGKTGTNPPSISFCHNGDSTFYNSIISASQLTFDGNCYDFTGTSEFRGSLFGATTSPGLCTNGGSMTEGGSVETTLAGWNALTSVGTDIDEAQTFNSNLQPTSASCSTKGARFASSGATPTPTPTAGGGFVPYIQ